MRRSTTFLMCLSALVMVSACSRPAGNQTGGGAMAPAPESSPNAPGATPEQNPPATPPPAAPDQGQTPPATPPTDQSGEQSSEKPKGDDTTPH
jgi:hypothetical protein